MSTHTTNLFVHDLSSSILVAISRNKGETKEADEILRQTKTLEVQPEDFGNQKKDFLLIVLNSEDKESLQFESPNFQERQGNFRAILKLIMLQLHVWFFQMVNIH